MKEERIKEQSPEMISLGPLAPPGPGEPVLDADTVGVASRWTLVKMAEDFIAGGCKESFPSAIPRQPALPRGGRGDLGLTNDAQRMALYNLIVRITTGCDPQLGKIEKSSANSCKPASAANPKGYDPNRPTPGSCFVCMTTESGAIAFATSLARIVCSAVPKVADPNKGDIGAPAETQELISPTEVDKPATLGTTFSIPDVKITTTGGLISLAISIFDRLVGGKTLNFSGSLWETRSTAPKGMKPEDVAKFWDQDANTFKGQLIEEITKLGVGQPNAKAQFAALWAIIYKHFSAFRSLANQKYGSNIMGQPDVGAGATLPEELLPPTIDQTSEVTGPLLEAITRRLDTLEHNMAAKRSLEILEELLDVSEMPEVAKTKVASEIVESITVKALTRKELEDRITEEESYVNRLIEGANALPFFLRGDDSAPQPQQLLESLENRQPKPQRVNERLDADKALIKDFKRHVLGDDEDEEPIASVKKEGN